MVWLRLQSKHYQLLRPKGLGPPAQFVKECMAHAVYKPEQLEGAGHQVDPDCLSFLGLHSLAASARRGSVSGAQNTPGQCVDAYEYDSCLNCPCGWKPKKPSGKKRGQTADRQAKAHWRHCQGTLPPKGDPTNLAEFRRGMSAREALLKTDRSKGKYLNWRGKLSSKARSAAHSLDLTKASLVPRGWTYLCTACCNYHTINQTMTIPCPSRPDRSISALEFVKLAQPGRLKKFGEQSTRKNSKAKARLKAVFAANPDHWKQRYADLKQNRPQAYARKRALSKPREDKANAAVSKKRKRIREAKRAAKRKALATR